MNFLSSVLLIKRLPNYKLVIFLMILSGISEAFGISLLVPVVTSLIGESSKVSLEAPFNYLPEFLTLLGISPSLSFILPFVFVAMILSFLAVFIQERVLAISRYKFLAGIRNEASKNLVDSKWEYLKKISSGELSNKLLLESEKAAESIVAIALMLSFLIQIFFYLAISLMLSWEMTLIAIFTIVFTGFTSYRLIKLVNSYGIKSVEHNNAYNRQIVDVSRGMKLIKAFSIGEYVKSKLLKLNYKATEVQSKILINQALMKFEIQALISLALIFILIISIEFLSVEPAVLLIFLFIVLRITPKFFTFQGQFYSFYAHKPSLDVLNELIENSKKEFEQNSDDKKIFNNLIEKITFKNVDYKFDIKGDSVLKNINFDIPKYQFTSIVGPSGAGKSTLIDLIMGLLIPSKGSIFIDDENLNSLNLNSFKEKIGFVPQEDIFFDGSLKENICFDKDIPEGKILEALNIVQLKDFFNSLKQGLEYNIGEGGKNLSGGQRQRLSIARALLRNPSILILDEATSSLDSNSEKLFQVALDKISKKYTLIVIAHKFDSIKNSDNIIVLNDGQISQQGTFEKLVNTSGLFQDLYKTQTKII